MERRGCWRHERKKTPQGFPVDEKFSYHHQMFLRTNWKSKSEPESFVDSAVDQKIQRWVDCKKKVADLSPSMRFKEWLWQIQNNQRLENGSHGPSPGSKQGSHSQVCLPWCRLQGCPKSTPVNSESKQSKHLSNQPNTDLSFRYEICSEIRDSLIWDLQVKSVAKWVSAAHEMHSPTM